LTKKGKTTTIDFDLLPDNIVAVVLFELPTHWTGFFTQLYQYLHRKPFWKFVHVVTYTKFNKDTWLRTELTWDGYSEDVVEGKIIEESDSLVVPLFRSQLTGVNSRAIHLQRTFNFLGESFRYSPWVSVLHLLSSAYQWNCASVASYLLGTVAHHLPSDLLEELIR
jgi:hypothetical protein